MKKIISLIIAVMLIIACVGCNEQSNPSSSLENSSSVSSEIETPTIEDLDYIDVSSKTLTNAEKAEVNKLFYQNNLSTETADPACVYSEEDGYFYLYGTNHSEFNCFRSKDLTSWEALNAAFKRPTKLNYSEVSSVMTQTEFNNYKNNTWLKNDYFWAPGVIYDAELDLYLMYFTARDGVTEPIKYQISLAYSKNPWGPFIQWTGRVNGQNGKSGVNTITYANGQTVSAYDINYNNKFIDFEKLNGLNGNYPYEGYIKVIDVEPFVDPKTGDKYLFFCRDLGTTYDTSCSMGMKMIDWFTPDYTTLTLLTKPNFEKVDDGAPYPEKDEGVVNEGQYVVYNPENQLYYLTYSCNFFWDKTYRVKQAWATSPLGPYTKIDAKKGGNVLATDAMWTHRAGAGHHVFTRVGSELFIVYHMHKNPKYNYSGSVAPRRVIGVDKISWVENEDGILVMKSGGPSYDYRLKPSLITGYTNVADRATVTVNQQMPNTFTKFLTDGGILTMANDGIFEFDGERTRLEVTLEFDTPITLKGIMAFNSYLVETAFDNIMEMEIDYTYNGEKYRGKVGEVSFDWDKYYYDNVKENSILPNYIPGCSSTAIFNSDIQNVTRINISLKRQAIKNDKPHTPIGLSVSDIYVIGK